MTGVVAVDGQLPLRYHTAERRGGKGVNSGSTGQQTGGGGRGAASITCLHNTCLKK